jgi:hypothetical protein
MLEQIGTMGFPNVHYAKTTIRSTVNTYPQINLPAWQAEFWHIGDRAKDVTTIWMLNQRVFFELEQIRQRDPEPECLAINVYRLELDE